MTNPQPPELRPLPCPCCGLPPLTSFVDSGWIIECRTFGVESIQEMAPTIDEAWAKWNHRTPEMRKGGG